MATTHSQITRTITVYREDPVWSRHTRWFNVPLTDLNRLFIAEFNVCGEDVTDRDVDVAATHIRLTHPDAVLVY